MQDELKLTNAQKEKLSAVWKARRPSEKSAEPRAGRLEGRKQTEETAKLVDGILSPDQSARLKQIHLQWLLRSHLARVLIMPDMLLALGITEDQQQKLEDLAASRSRRIWQRRMPATHQKNNVGNVSNLRKRKTIKPWPS